MLLTFLLKNTYLAFLSSLHPHPSYHSVKIKKSLNNTITVNYSNYIVDSILEFHSYTHSEQYIG